MRFLPLLEPVSIHTTAVAASKRIAATSCATVVLLCGALADNQCANAATGASKPTSSQSRNFIGMAHYYADNLHGRRTASGQVHDRNKMTAAHRSLPFGTRLKVTNKKNGKSCEVVVNDRGPFHPKFNLDLSQAAAKELGFFSAGKGLLECIIVDHNAIAESMKIAKQPQINALVAQQAAAPATASTQTPSAPAIGVVKSPVQAKSAPGPVIPVIKVMPVMVDEAALAAEVQASQMYKAQLRAAQMQTAETQTAQMQTAGTQAADTQTADTQTAETQTAGLPTNQDLPSAFADQATAQQAHHNPANEIADNVKAQNAIY